MAKYKLISEQQDFDDAVLKIKQSKVIGLDTEFLRTVTYFPILCLIQISTELEDCFLFDVHSKLINWSALLSVFLDKSITKIIHSAEQDIEAVLFRFNVRMSSIIDTQIIASLLEIGKQTGYGALVEHYYGIKLNKDKQFSAWHKRPLSEKQLEYAALDVKYLIGLYNKMATELPMIGKSSMAEVAEISSRIKVKTKNVDSSSINKLTKSICSQYHITEEANQKLAKKIIELRETLAIKHNTTRKLVLKDSSIADLVAGLRISELGRYVTQGDIEAIRKKGNK